uniref:XK-related protein n=1 Tax=Strigamia maritima TaxID=126957 RepID=T1IQT0_STRMM
MSTTDKNTSSVGTVSSDTPYQTTESLETIETDSSTFVKEYTYWNCFCDIAGIIFFYFDLFSDVTLIASYYNEGFYTYAGLTMAFVIVPSVLISIFSIIWYCSKDAIELISPVPPTMWTLRILFHLLLMALVWRKIESVYFGCKNLRNPNPEYTTYKAKFKATTTLLSVIDAYLESAPQLLLQLYILIHGRYLNQRLRAGLASLFDKKEAIHDSTSNPIAIPVSIEDHEFTSDELLAIEIVVICKSFICLVLELTFYARRNELVSKFGSAKCFFLWHCIVILFRIVALSFFASSYLYWFFIVLFVRLIVLETCRLILTRFRLHLHSSSLKLGLGLVLSFIQLITYIESKDLPDIRICFYVYYTCDFTENTTLLILWFYSLTPN